MTLAYTGLRPTTSTTSSTQSACPRPRWPPGPTCRSSRPSIWRRRRSIDLIVFSYGYMDEIAAEIRGEMSVRPDLVSLLDLLRPA